MAGPDGVRAGAGSPITAMQAVPGDALQTQPRDVRAPTMPSTDRGVTVRLPKGSAAQLVEAIKARAAPAEAGVLEAAEKLASQEKWGGRVQGAFRVGGKVLIVVGIATHAYRIYTATDKVKTSVEVAGGWTGAAIAGGAFAAWYAPADLAGPWAWVGHGVGTLVAGGIGYFAGSEIARTAYELTVEGKPLEVGR